MNLKMISKKLQFHGASRNNDSVYIAIRRAGVGERGPFSKIVLTRETITVIMRCRFRVVFRKQSEPQTKLLNKRKKGSALSFDY